MTLESINPLRMWSKCYSVDGDVLLSQDEISKVADEIECEVSERCIELPVDSEGVQWKRTDRKFISPYGAMVDLTNIAYDFPRGKWLIGTYDADFGMKRFFYAEDCRHVKPDLIKELLEEFGNAVSKQDVDFDILDAVDEYAAKIREVVSDEHL